MIVCLGWGSLIWCQKQLPVRGSWHTDGPALPVEFARESRDRRITLVLCEGHAAIDVLWAELDVSTLDDAKQALAVREGVNERNIANSIGYWTANGASRHLGAEAIGQWASQSQIAGIVWTALKPKIGEEYRVPRRDEVIAHLGALDGIARDAAEEYIRVAPRQIATSYRSAIEQKFGWTPTGLM